MEDERCVFLLNQVYRYHNLLTNFFIASMHIMSKERNPATKGTRKQYDKARTPYERVLEHLKEGNRRKKLIELRESLDSIELEEKIEKAFKRLFRHMFPERFLHE